MLYANDGASPRQTLEPGSHLTSDAVWFDLVNPTEGERDAAEKLTGLRVPSRDDVAEIQSSSRLYAEDGVMYFSMPYSYRGGDGRSQLVPVGFVLSNTHLITLRYAVLPAFELFTERFAHAGKPNSSEVFVGLVEAIVDRVADVLEHVGAELDGLSKETFSSEDMSVRSNARRADRRLRGILTSVGRCGDALGNLRDSVLSLGRIAAYAQQARTEWVPAELKTRLATLRQDITSLNDYDQQLNQKVSFLLDAVLGFINIEQNNSVKVLTVVSVVGIPPTFVVGLYGMNFKNMPEYDWSFGYEYAWVVILFSVIVPLIWFRIKGWM
jgi:magnesium transporter